MKPYRRLVTAGAVLTIMGVLAGCGAAGNGTNPATNTTNTATANVIPTTITNQISTNQTTTRPIGTSSADMVDLNLTNTQIKMIATAVKKINGNPSTMTIGTDEKVYTPKQIPQGQQFLHADYGADVIFGAYVSLYFSGFTVTLGGPQRPSQLAVRKSNSVKLSNGATGTWYVSDSTTGGTTYYLMTAINKTYISFYSNLKTVSKAEIEQMAGSMVLLGTNQSNNTFTNTSTPPSNTTVAAMVSVTVPLTYGQSTPFMSFKVPSGWVKQKVGQGDASGYAWVNPHQSGQQIDLITSGNIGAIKNYTTGQWDVTGIFGHGTKGISWTGVSPDKLTGGFMNTTGVNPYAKSEQTPYTGYGKAFIVQNPNPFSVFVEAWGLPLHADAVLPTIRLHETVYVFSQAMLEEIYAVKSFRSVGPIIPPQNVANDVNKWAPYVSMSMLPYAPASEQALDKELIQNIEGPMTLLKSLPGYTLHQDQLPSGGRTYWYPSNNQFPTWVDPTPQQITK